ncbi:N-acetylgalactosamine kinase isoform X2 [Halyomorpha halys]|uniref:N-acetylgalactosamine kinase isoform X2 n=1 Tax=Halyomorpha halys TaxID=286706 RepID=UPI0006D4E2EA|nr:N-acetylgalactosamine kinase isoform X2 [Halyomorpha halys]
MSEFSNDNSVFPLVHTHPKNNDLHGRLKKLKQIFYSKFSFYPDVYFRVPGRVNLIGEHIDYCGYSVCPLAIDKDILLAAKAVEAEPFLEITNLDSKYPDCIVPDSNFIIDRQKYGWGAYVLCGIRGALEKIEGKPISLRFAIAGTISPGSGLSSSSAIVSASLLATTYLNKLTLPKTELATMSAICEQYIGTAGGGMDQAIAFCATEGCAKHIEFNPLRTTDVSLPREAVFVIANSLVTKNKAESDDFNTRVVETRLVAQVLANQQLSKANIDEMRIADVQAELDVSLEKMISLVKGTFHEDPYTKEELCRELAITEDELLSKILTPDTRHLSHFHLYHRGLHVVEEAFRVQKWLSADSIQTLGCLMNESHQSLRDLYEASHPSLDRLIKDCQEGGAFGARLTGAGWGGCVVAITTEDNVDNFMESLAKSYYKDYDGDFSQVVFATQPGTGAQIFTSI